MGFEAAVASEFAEAVCTTEKDVGGGSFGDEEEHENEDGGGNPENFPERPAPAFGFNGEAGEQRSEGGTAVGGGDPDGKRVGEVK